MTLGELMDLMEEVKRLERKLDQLRLQHQASPTPRLEAEVKDTEQLIAIKCSQQVARE